MKHDPVISVNGEWHRVETDKNGKKFVQVGSVQVALKDFLAGVRRLIDESHARRAECR